MVIVASQNYGPLVLGTTRSKVLAGNIYQKCWNISSFGPLISKWFDSLSDKKMCLELSLSPSLSLSIYLSIYIYIYICCMYIYIFIYMSLYVHAYGNFTMTIGHTITIRDKKQVIENWYKAYLTLFVITLFFITLFWKGFQIVFFQEQSCL